MKNLLLITVGIFLLLSLIAPIRLKTTTPQQCGYNGPGNTDETCIANCTLCNTNAKTSISQYPSIEAYRIDIKNRNNYQPRSLYESDIVRNEIIIAILAIGFFFVIRQNC